LAGRGRHGGGDEITLEAAERVQYQGQDRDDRGGERWVLVRDVGSRGVGKAPEKSQQPNAASDFAVRAAPAQGRETRPIHTAAAQLNHGETRPVAWRTGARGAVDGREGADATTASSSAPRHGRRDSRFSVGDGPWMCFGGLRATPFSSTRGVDGVP